jgi:two-component system response regulator DegU
MDGELPPAERSLPSRIVIANDHALVRERMRAMLAEEPDLEAVAEAEDGPEALELCRRLRPDLVLMDVRMLKMDGLEATRAIKRQLPRTVVLIVTLHEGVDYLLEALKVGAAGYVLKEAISRGVIEAIRGSLSGEKLPLDRGLAEQLILRLVDEKKREEEIAEEPATSTSSIMLSQERCPQPLLSKPLTPREEEVLRLLVRGQTNREIAQNLVVGVTTVKKHVQKILQKLEVSDRTQAAVRTVELELLSEGQGREQKGSSAGSHLTPPERWNSHLSHYVLQNVKMGHLAHMQAPGWLS